MRAGLYHATLTGMAKTCVNTSGPKKGKLKKGYKFGKGGKCVHVGGSSGHKGKSGKKTPWCTFQSGAKKGKLRPGHTFAKGGGCVRRAGAKAITRGKVQYGPTRAHFIEPADVSHLPLDGRRYARMSMRHLMRLDRMRPHTRRHRRY